MALALSGSRDRLRPALKAGQEVGSGLPRVGRALLRKVLAGVQPLVGGEILQRGIRQQGIQLILSLRFTPQVRQIIALHFIR